jgi:hypothetical protein
MNPEDRAVEPTHEQNDEPAYEPPRIESSMTPEELAREVAYAGVTDVTVPIG